MIIKQEEIEIRIKKHEKNKLMIIKQKKIEISYNKA